METKHDALIVWFAENYLHQDPLDVIDRIVNDSHAEGVDSILIDEQNLDLMFIQARTVESFDKTETYFPENDVKSTLTGGGSGDVVQFLYFCRRLRGPIGTGLAMTPNP